MAGLRVVCGLLALGLGVVSLQASVAQSRTNRCVRVVHVGPVSATGCWRRAGGVWTARAPVTLNGLKLTGGGSFTADSRAGTITSSSSARWLIGTVQFRRAPFAWQRTTPLRFPAIGALRGLPFSGTETLSFNRSDGGTARLAAKLAIPGAAGGVNGDAMLTVTRRHPFNVQSVKVHVGQLPLGRLFFDHLDFRYARSLWVADAEIRLPAFTSSPKTLAGHLEIANGSLRRIAVTGDGLSIPLGEGFVLTKAGFDLGLGPLVIQGSGAAVYGPPIGGRGALEIDGLLQYSSLPERWQATGTVSLPWGLPGTKPTATVGLEIHPGRAMIFTSHLDLSVHGMGLTGELNGFASGKAFNAEGTADLKLPVFKLNGTALVSSKAVAACGAVHFLFLKKKLGFGYTWNGALDIMGSSCDVGRFRVPMLMRSPLSFAATPIGLSSPAGFAVFSAQGGDFAVSGPTGTFQSTPERDGDDAFAFHDTTTNTTYLAIKTNTTEATYTVTPLAGATLAAVTVANGLLTHKGTGDVTAGVTGSGPSRTLVYGLDAPQFQPGETVSFYQGQSDTVAGATPIVEDVTSTGTADFTPEPLGQTSRFVFAVVSIDGKPREAYQVASFSASPVLAPSASVVLRASGSGGFLVSIGRPQRVATWRVLSTTADGTKTWQEVPGTTQTIDVPAAIATIALTPVDQFGRDGPTYVCDTAKDGSCPAA
jgi:hypothetical protein